MGGREGQARGFLGQFDPLPPTPTHRPAGISALPGHLTGGLLPALEGPQETHALSPAAGRPQLHGAPGGAADPGVL